MAGLNGAEERVDDGLMNLDFSRICRLCLNFSREFVDLRPSNGNRNGARHIIDQIKYCYSIKIDLNEPFPSKICFQCIQVLTLFSATKRNIKYSEMMLRNILNIRNANHLINSQSRQGINLSNLQRYLQTSDDRQREQGPSVVQDRPTQDNSHIQNLRISPMQITTVQELYRQQNPAVQNEDNQNVPTNPNLSQSTDKLTEKRNVENRKSNTGKRNVENRKSNTEKRNVENQKPNTEKRNIENSNTKIENPKTNTENARVVENKPTEAKQNDSSDTNSNTVESSRSRPSCSTITNSTPQEENVGKTTKTPEEDNMKSTNKKPNVVNNINRKRSFGIDRKRDLRVKLEILDLKNAKKFCSPSTDSPRVSTEGQGGGTSGETTSGKVVKEIGTVIDESNILSPKVKRMRKSIPKG